MLHIKVCLQVLGSIAGSSDVTQWLNALWVM